MAWRTGTATDYVDLLNKLRDHATGTHVATAAINAAGTGYTVNDIVTIAGGTAYQAAKVKITAVAAGVPTTIKLLLGGGSYSANPASPNTPTGGTGTGLTLNLTFASNGWTVQRDVTVLTTEKELILLGTGSGSDSIYVGIRTFRDTNTLAFNWELAGMTGYTGANPWGTQPGISPGRFDNPQDTRLEGGSYLPLDNAALTYWFSVTPRRILIAVKISTTYVTAYLGFYNSFSTAAEQPYPLVVVGMCPQRETRFNSTRESMSFLANPCAKTADTFNSIPPVGPFQVRWVDGAWYTFYNRIEAFGSNNSSAYQQQLRQVTPMDYTRITGRTTEDGIVTTQWRWDDLVPTSGITPNLELHPTPNSGGTLSAAWPIGMMMETPSQQILGELDGCFWVSTFGSGLASEDTLLINNEEYLILQNGFRTENFQYMCILEA